MKLLALAPAHRLHREQAMDLLWPELDSKAAANNLHHALHIARRTLQPSAGSASGYLRLRGENLALSPEEPLWVDVEAFEEAATTARHALEPAAYRAAIDLYSGELLPQDRYEAWAEQRRAQLRGLYLSLLLEVTGIYEERKEYGEAIEALGKVVAEDPAHEGAHVGLMRLYALLGRRREALGQYERLRDALLGSLARARGRDRTPARGDLGWHLPTTRFAAGRWLPIGRFPCSGGRWQTQSAPDAHQLHRTRARDTGGQAAAFHDEAVDAHGGWRLGQDATGHRGGNGSRRSVPGWGMAGRAGIALGGRASAPGGGQGSRSARAARAGRYLRRSRTPCERRRCFWWWTTASTS